MLLEFRLQLAGIGLGLVRHPHQDFDHARVVGHLGHAAHLQRTLAHSGDLRVGHPTLIARRRALSAVGGKRTLGLRPAAGLAGYREANDHAALVICETFIGSVMRGLL